jgi:hypothetical protein
VGGLEKQIFARTYEPLNSKFGGHSLPVAPPPRIEFVWHHPTTTFFTTYIQTRKYMHAETLALLTKPLYFPNMKYLK